MANEKHDWKVLGHGPLEKLADNLWWVQGDLPGMSLKRCMTIARLSDGRLVIYNGISLREPEMKQIEAWGTPAFLIVPSAYHRLDARAYKTRYPQLKVIAPKGAKKKVEDVISVDGTFEDFIADAHVKLEMLAGVKEREGVMIVKSSDGTSLVFNDVVMNMDKKKDFLGYMFTTVMGSAPGPRVSRLVKLAIVDRQGEFRQELDRLSAIPDLVRVIVAHEKVAFGRHARACLQGAMQFLRA